MLSAIRAGTRVAAPALAGCWLACAAGWSGADSLDTAATTPRVPVGFENVSTAPGLPPQVGFENRRWRHSAEALGRLRRAFPVAAAPADSAIPFVAFERRLGLAAAAVTPVEENGRVRFAVRYPSDPSFPHAPAGPFLHPTFWRPDVELQPLLSYQFGHLLQPVAVRMALAPRVRIVPWPGALATASVELPIRNDFAADSLHPDIDQVRPGQLSLDQYAWLPQVALVSASGGFFGDNRWGGSLGIARPIAEGVLLLDAQVDVTGFLSFGPGAVEYSTPDFWTGFGGVVWRPPFRDVAVRAHVQRYLGGDRGAEVEVRRSIGDLDAGVFVARTAGVNLLGVRLGLPLPPMTRAAAVPARFQLVERWPFEHRTSESALADPLRGVASREEFLRQLARPTLEANQDRYRLARGPRPDLFAHGGDDWLSWSGMTGFVNTPWAGVESDRQFEAGYAQVPARWAYDQRKLHDNQIYSVTVGFLPHVEGSLRATAFPGLRTFETELPESRLTDVDEMVSGRVELLSATARHPGLAIGVEDVQGTRRFNSTYAVTGMRWQAGALSGRVSAGWAPTWLTAIHHTLDGGFGAAEVAVARGAALQAEYDSEKWTLAVAGRLPYGLRVRAALLGLTHASFGGGFHFAL